MTQLDSVHSQLLNKLGIIHCNCSMHDLCQDVTFLKVLVFECFFFFWIKERKKKVTTEEISLSETPCSLCEHVLVWFASLLHKQS